MTAMKSFLHKTLKVLILAVAFIPAFTACESDDDPQVEPEKPIKLNDFEDFQSCIIRTDSLGNFEYRSYGEPLLEEDSTILYIGVDDMEEAKDLFEIWMPYGVETYSTGLADNLTAVFTDKNYQRQGEIYFTAGKEDYIADVTFSEELSPKHFSTIRFISNEKWPSTEAESIFQLGDVYNYPYENIATRAICIREKGNGKKALFFTYTNKKWPDNNMFVYDPKAAKCREIYRYLKKDLNFFVECFKKTGREFNPDQWFWAGSSNIGRIKLNIKTGATGETEPGRGEYNYTIECIEL